ncbi:hypothetical protein [Lacisediminihabitans profunda]|uniref:DUF2029 domain-containing protein n=1 Tax=Lacisediminihabitans profunda TaxID=2594790 RepID=A0A5C8UJ39_9MICO|nr:hypothetical protein [Lacisediminihabitans profunda]TXN28251.1 hypothetical protein FVP33_17395 [Lacisediminihabitans profunda]
MPHDPTLEVPDSSGQPGPGAAVGVREGRRTPWTPATLHYGSLVLGFVAILWIGHDQWFFGDDWAILVPRLDASILVPHVGHWNMSPAIVFQSLRNWLGLGSYLPFLALAVLAHVAVVHLVWRILNRVGVQPWLASVLGIALLLLGGASENIFWAFQFGFMGAIALGLWVLVLFDRPRLNIPLILVLSLLAPTFSGTAIPVLAAAAAVGVVRHGWWRTGLLLVPTAASYLVWYVLVARGYAVPAAGITSIGGVARAGLYAAAMYGGGLGRGLPVIWLGVIPALTTAVWAIRTVRRGLKSRAAAAYAMVGGSLVFVALTTYSRMSFGISAAASERYAYLVIVFLLPALGLQLTWLAARGRRAFAAVAAGLVLIIGFNTVDLVIEAHAQAVRETGSERRIDADLARLLESPGDPALLARAADATWSPDLLGADLLALYRSGEFPKP